MILIRTHTVVTEETIKNLHYAMDKPFFLQSLLGEEVTLSYNMNIEEDLKISKLTKKQFKYLLSILKDTPAKVNEINIEDTQAEIKRAWKLQRKTNRRFNKMLQVIAESRQEIE